MNKPNRKLPESHDNVSTRTDEIYGLTAKVWPQKCGVKKDSFLAFSVLHGLNSKERSLRQVEQHLVYLRKSCIMDLSV